MKFQSINPNNGIKGQLFGLPIGIDQAGIVLIPAPWEVTSSISAGTVLGPETILRNSYRIGLHEEKWDDAWRVGIGMLQIPHGWKLKSDQLCDTARTYLQAWESGSKVVNTALTSRIDQYTAAFKDRIKNKGLMYMNKGKMVGLVGGEHTCALGLMEACAERYQNFGILQIDAHADLRKGYQGFSYSHASVMYHALQISEVSRLVQVGLRDYCEEEAKMIAERGDKVTSFTDYALKKAMFEGKCWAKQCDSIIERLPQKVYISFDIDGLDPKLCPSTSRPVPGGLDLPQVIYLIEKVVEAGKEIVAFDLSEVAFNGETDWDGLVASYLLYKLSMLMAKSKGKL
ncbi:MAG: arginase family protein [Bacteroidota bacterium]